MKLKLKPRYSLIAALIVAISVTLIMLGTAGCGSPEANPTAMPSSAMANEQRENMGEPAEADSRRPATTEAAGSLTVQEGSGATLLQTHCAQCHSLKLLELTRKSRAEWEKTLARMERHTGLLGDTEKRLVLEQLTASDEP